jgi:hypothetical protein
VTFEPAAAAGNLSIVVSDNAGVTLSRIDGVASGTPVTLTVPACGMVTAVRSGIPDAITWTGVQPGDDLVDPRVALAPVEVSVSTQGAPDEVGYYTMYLSCADGITLQDGEDTAAAVSGISSQCPANATSVAASFMASYQSTTAYTTATGTIASGTASLTFGAFAPAPMTTHVDLTGVAAFDELYIQTRQIPVGGLAVPYAQTTIRIDAYDALPATVSIDASTLLPLLTYTTSSAGDSRSDCRRRRGRTRRSRSRTSRSRTTRRG